MAVTERARIELRAYEIYVARGGEAGRELDDWLIAEQELSAEQDREVRGRVDRAADDRVRDAARTGDREFQNER